MYDELVIGNPYFIQTIELLKYQTKLRKMKQDDLIKELNCESPKIPQLKSASASSINQNKYTKESIDEISKKTMILILTHAGYSNVEPECFNLLTDLLKAYLKNLTSLFRRKLDQEMILNDNSSNVINNADKDSNLLLLGKVFNELGLSFSTFQQFNHELVLYRDHILNQIEELKISHNQPATR